MFIKHGQSVHWTCFTATLVNGIITCHVKRDAMVLDASMDPVATVSRPCRANAYANELFDLVNGLLVNHLLFLVGNRHCISNVNKWWGESCESEMRMVNQTMMLCWPHVESLRGKGKWPIYYRSSFVHELSSGAWVDVQFGVLAACHISHSHRHLEIVVMNNI